MSEFLNSIFTKLQEILDPAVLGEKFAEGLVNSIVVLVVFFVFYLLWWIIRWIARPALQRANVDRTLTAFIETVIKYTVLIIGAIYALNAVGINTGALAASLGIAGLTIGFAARDALSNLISGILIFLDRPFVIGDLVEIEDHYGRVDQITLRSTRIVTRDGKMLAVPNSEIINKTVASYTNFPHLRLDVAVTVAVTENLDQARKLLLEVIEDDPDYLDDPAPRVVVTQLNDYNVEVELQAWIRNERLHVEKRFELREKIFKAFTEAGVEMPFETIQLSPLDVKVKQ